MKRALGIALFDNHHSVEPCRGAKPRQIVVGPGLEAQIPQALAKANRQFNLDLSKTSSGRLHSVQDSRLPSFGIAVFS
jgi:hypothetical protein